MSETKAECRGVGLTVLAASFGFAIVQLDVTIVNVALPTIAKALNARTADLQWVVDSYAVSFAALLLSAGYFGDRFGARRVYLAGILIFALASAACGLAPTPAVMIASRAAQGLGAAAMMPCSLALLNHATGHNQSLRAQAVGWWTAAGAIAIAAGPVAGGFLLGLTGWRGIFLINLPICALAALLTLLIAETEVRSQGGFDLPGQMLAIAALALLTASVIEARPLGMTNGLAPAMAAFGVMCSALFIIAERRREHPMLPLQLFSNATLSAAVGYGIIANLTYYGIIFVLSLYLQRVLNYSPLDAGLAFLPLTATFFIVNILSGWWVGKAGSRPPMIVGALIDALGFAALLLLDRAENRFIMLAAFTLLPAGMGLGVPAMTSAVLASVDKLNSGVAAGALNASRQAGGAMGVALFGAFADGGTEEIVAGLHNSAIFASALLVLAALIAWKWVRPGVAAPQYRPAKWRSS